VRSGRADPVRRRRGAGQAVLGRAGHRRPLPAAAREGPAARAAADGRSRHGRGRRVRRRAPRAFQTEDGDLVMLDDEELAELEPRRRATSRSRASSSRRRHAPVVRPPVLPRPGRRRRRVLRAGRGAARQEREGIARWVMRKKEYVGALRVEGDHLLLMTLRHAGEVVPAIVAGTAGRPGPGQARGQHGEAARRGAGGRAGHDGVPRRVPRPRPRAGRGEGGGQGGAFPKAPKKARRRRSATCSSRA
jgi:hypothetical protein